jgi:amino acid transporter
MSAPTEPKATLTVTDAAAIIVGVVVGAAIFRTPSTVAAGAGGYTAVLLAWLGGGALSLIGALCYAELATSYPHVGGDYYYLNRAYGRDLAMLLGWARLTVIQTGSIAMMAYVFGDYAAQILPLGKVGPAVYAAAAVMALTAMNALGVQQGKWTQNVLTALKVCGLLAVAGVGFYAAPAAAAAPPVAGGSGPGLGVAMVLVLLTYGGWNEAAYISAELRDVHRNMIRALVLGIGTIAVCYFLINMAYLRGLGVSGVAKSDAVAADLLKHGLGAKGAVCISVLVSLCTLGSVNGMIFTGARTSYALGRDFTLFRLLGQWHHAANTPRTALLVQGAISLALLGLGAWTGEGFDTMVAYTTPVFWFFLLLAGLSLFVLRTTDPETPRPFRVPLYPVTPLLFCATCLYMLHSGLGYAASQAWTIGARTGIAVLFAGLPVALLARRWQSQ